MGQRGVSSHMIVLVCAVFSRLCVAGGIEDPQFAQRLHVILNQHAVMGTRLYARVLHLPDRREVFAENADQPCKPASTYKLLTTAAGLG